MRHQDRTEDGIGIMTLEGVTPTTECLVVARDALLAMRYDAEKPDGGGYDYSMSKIVLDASGLGLRFQMNGIITGVDPDDEGLVIAMAGALPSGFADYAVAIADKWFMLAGADMTNVAFGIDLSPDELGDRIRQAWRTSKSNLDYRLWSQAAEVTDICGRPIGIGDWIQAGGDKCSHRVVGVAINEFHGPMVMVDDAITGGWFALADDTRIVSNPIASWEDLIDVAERRILPKAELVRIARHLAGDAVPAEGEKR